MFCLVHGLGVGQSYFNALGPELGGGQVRPPAGSGSCGSICAAGWRRKFTVSAQRECNAAPRRGSIGIWNRSHYEDVLVPRVHKQISEEAWRARCEDINAFERLLARNGVTLLKFFLHISKDEQKARLQARLSDPHKLWKFNPGDLKERALWPDYQLAYEAVINRTSSEVAPWHVVSANHKWSRNVVVLRAMVAAMEAMNPQYPTPEFDPKTIVIE